MLSFDADGVPTVVAGDGFTAAETTVDTDDGDFTITVTSRFTPDAVLHITATPIGALAADVDSVKVLGYSISSNVLTVTLQTFYTDGNGAATAVEPDTATDISFSITYTYAPGATA
jgi:hypothetical protein